MKLAVVVCGPIASGKSTAISYLASEFSLRIVSFGGYLRSISDQNDGSHNRGALQDLGESLLRSKGQSQLLQAALEHVHVGSDDSVIFDGVRHLGILAEIRRSCSTTVAFYLHASQKERHRRYNLRLNTGISFDEFRIVESHPVEAGIAELKSHCELVIDATLSLSEIQGILWDSVSLAISNLDDV